MNEPVPPPEPSSAPSSAGPLDIAMAAEAHEVRRGGPARILLEKQGRLVDEQIALARNERFRNRIKAARDASLAALALAVVAGAAWIVWDASRANGVVIEPFAVAPAFAQQGITPSVAANRLLGRVAEMQASTQSSRTRRATHGDGDELSMEIPQTGVSAGEILRLLRRRFGHETIITGELAMDAAGQPTLRVYADGAPLRLPAPPAGTPDAAGARDAEGASTADYLLDRGAEAVFGKTDAYRYSTWLRFRDGRELEGRKVLHALSAQGPPEERAWALSGLASDARQEGRLEDSMALAEEAARLNPDLPNAYGNMSSTASLRGHRERQLREELRKTAAVERLEGEGAALRAGWTAAAIMNDEHAALRGLEAALTEVEGAGQADTLILGKAAVQAALHDVTGARRTTARLNVPLEPGDYNLKDQAWWRLAPLGRWAELEAALRAPSDEPADPTLPLRTSTRLQPRLAHAVARQGRHAEAVRLIAATPLDCYWCVLNRGWVWALGGDPKAADRWFAEALRQGPSLPEGYSEWGEAKLARGDVHGAIRLLDQAQRRAPRWADPLKLEGDALARQGKHRQAVRRYAAAAERAPRWGALHLAWGRSLQALGREERAYAKYAQAARLDLSAAERAEVARRLRARAACARRTEPRS